MDLCELRKFEDGPRHPWEIARLALIEAVLKRQDTTGKRLLEIGCGDGFVVAELASRLSMRDAMGVDPFLTDDLLDEMNKRPDGVRFVREAGADERFDFATLLDVLEHVEDDRALLNGAVRRLLPDGYVMITVPAGPGLMSSHDMFMSHYRRYSRSMLSSLIDDCDLEPVRSGALFGSLAVVRLLQMTGEKIFGEPEAPSGLAGWRGGRFLARVVATVLAFEGRMMMALSGLGMPLPGLSLWTLCRKKNEINS